MLRHFFFRRTLVAVFVKRLRIKLVEKLNYVEAALVDIKMYVPCFKIRSAGLPYFSFGMHLLNFVPRRKSDSAAVHFRKCEKQFKMVVIGFFVNKKHHTACFFAFIFYYVALTFFFVKTAFYCLSRNYLTVFFKVVVTKSEFFYSSVLEGPLIFLYKPFSVLFR